jgi:hypothetical protein
MHQLTLDCVAKIFAMSHFDRNGHEVLSVRIIGVAQVRTLSGLASTMTGRLCVAVSKEWRSGPRLYGERHHHLSVPSASMRASFAMNSIF